MKPLKPYEVLCLNCNGTEYAVRHKGYGAQRRTTAVCAPCNICGGSGKIDWVKQITRGSILDDWWEEEKGELMLPIEESDLVQKIKDFEKRIETLESKLEDADSKIEDLEFKLNNTDSKVDDLDTDSVNSRVDDQESRLDDLKSKKDDSSPEITTLE